MQTLKPSVKQNIYAMASHIGLTLQSVFIDIHTHTVSSNKNSIYNVVVQSSHHDAPTTLFTAGIHPWYIDDVQLQIEKLQNLVQNPNCIAIGEIGLDTLCSTDHELQQQAFVAQINLAQQMKLPIIIHNVRSTQRIIDYLKKYSFQQAVIFHGYNLAANHAQKILDAGYCISFGKALLQPKSAAAAVLASIDLSKIFFETDHAQQITIEEIYAAAVNILKMPLPELQQRVIQNFNTNFTRATL